MAEATRSDRDGFFDEAPTSAPSVGAITSGLTRRRVLVSSVYGAAALALGLRPEPPDTVRRAGVQPLVEINKVGGETLGPLGPSLGNARYEDLLFDTVISGGRVIDPESGYDQVANVGIADGRIVAITTAKLYGRTDISAESKVVAPGFVDLLSYDPKPFGAQLKLLDGVTTNLAMHGVSNYGSAFFDAYSGDSPVNFGGAFHHHFMRGADLKARPDLALKPAQLDRLVELARDGLAQGLAGISFSLEYSPGTTGNEIERLAEVAAEANQVCFFHLRHSGQNLAMVQKGLTEALNIGRRFGVAIHIEHLTSTGGTGQMATAIGLIESARSSGVDSTACFYPYDFWGTFLASARFSTGWRESFGLSYEDLQIAGTDTRLSEETFAEAQRHNRLVAALGSIPAADIDAAFDVPWSIIASDAIATADLNTHPRGAGTFARTLGMYVRKLGSTDLRSALAKMTILPTKRVEDMIPVMKKKGRLQAHCDADIVVFDPDQIIDTATISNPAAGSKGVEHVLLGGMRAVQDGQIVSAFRPGTALRGSTTG